MENQPLWMKKIGEKMIVLTNEDRPPIVCFFVWKDEKDLTSFKDAETGEIFYCMGMVFPFNQKWLDFLNSIPDFKERWSLLISHTILKDYLR